MKSRGRTRATGQDLALGHNLCRDLEEESEVVNFMQTLQQSESEL